MSEPLWDTQLRALDMMRGAAADGCRAICVCAPTGAGKTRVMTETAVRCVAKGRRVLLLTNRRLLTGQAVKAFAEHGLHYGVLAAGFGDTDLSPPAIVASFQTVEARCYQRRKWSLPLADVVLVDEAHSNKAGVASKVIAHYRNRGSLVFGFSATPTGLGHLYERLLVTCTKAELRAAGALVRCDVFAPGEPNMKGVRRNAVGEYVHKEKVKRIMETVVFGDVFDHWETLNPTKLPTILFAPGVPESVWFTNQFRERGVGAAHIDANTPDDERERIIRGSEDGSVTVVSSCGVLREGVDMPWLYHGILVQVCGTTSGYYQTVGRLLRAYTRNPRYDKTHCVLQDHSGAANRIGSPNADPPWELNKTDMDLENDRQGARDRGEEREPIRCPQCTGFRLTGAVCPHCGFAYVPKERGVRMTGGTLQKVAGNTVKKRGGEDDRLWRSCLFAGGCGGKTMNQVRADFLRRARRPLPPGLPYMPPAGSTDWNLRVAELYPWTDRRKKAG